MTVTIHNGGIEDLFGTVAVGENDTTSEYWSFGMETLDLFSAGWIQQRCYMRVVSLEALPFEGLA